MIQEEASPLQTPALRAEVVTDNRAGRSTATQLIGMPVIALDTGANEGEIHDVVYNPRAARLVGFTVLKGAGFFGGGTTRYLADSAVHAIGTDAVVVQSAGSLEERGGDVNDIAKDAGEAVLGKRLMTDDGSFLGSIDDVLIERETRRVVAYEVSGGIFQDLYKGQADVPVDHIISIGKDVVVVPASLREKMDTAKGGLLGAASAAQERIDEARTTTAAAIERSEADYARGKIVGSDITEESGEVIVPEGAVITDDHIHRCIAAGKLHALAAAAGMEQAAAATTSARDTFADAGAALQERYAEHTAEHTAGQTADAEPKAAIYHDPSAPDAQATSLAVVPGASMVPVAEHPTEVVVVTPPESGPEDADLKKS